jgi:hypothetical protein
VGANAGAVEKRHPKRDTVLLNARQQALPDPKPGPADEGLSRRPPRTEFGRDGTPLGAVLMSLDDGLHRAAQIVMLRLAAWTALLNQR